MSLFGDIGKALGGALDSITKIADTVTSFLKAPLQAITAPLDGLVNGLLSKLPLGIGSAIAPFADAFLNAGVSWLAGGPLGGLMSMLSTAGNTASAIDTALDAADKAVDGGLAALSDPAKQNAQNAFAYSTAQSLLS